MIIRQIDGKLLQKMIISAANNLENNKKIVDDLNVFPVPDGDTGTNMSLTLLAAAKEVKHKDDYSISSIANVLATASLRGARGNSGVILSQLFRGFAKGLKTYETADTKAFAYALESGVKTAYKAVMKPTEGTILTVAREGAAKAQELSLVTENIIEMLEKAIDYAKTVLAKTPDMLLALKQAGVVDAGGKGLVIILEGALHVLKFGEIVQLTDQVDEKPQLPDREALQVTENIEFTYCTEFLICKDGVQRNNLGLVNEFRDIIAVQGDSMLVIDDDDVVKVHIHTNNPGLVLQEALKIGELTNIKIDNMKEQHEHIQTSSVQTEENKEYGFIAVAVGEGIINVFKDLGVDEVIEGGQTMNPSTDDILHHLNKVKANNIFVFPNNKNIILAAEQATTLSDKNIIVIPTHNIAQGIAAMLAFDMDTDVDENRNNMTNAIEGVKTGSITYAVRNCTIDDKEIAEGDILGIINSDISTVGKSIDTVGHQLLETLIDEDSLMVTIFYGQDIDEQTAQQFSEYIENTYPDCDVEIHNGGQPLYYYIISVE